MNRLTTHRCVAAAALALGVLLPAIVVPSRASAEIGQVLIPLLEGEIVHEVRDIEKQLAAEPSAAAIRRLQRLNREVWGKNYVIPVRDLQVRNRGKSSYGVSMSVTDYIIGMLRALSPEMVAVYRQEYDLAARALFDEAVRRRDPEELSRCLELYPVASSSHAVAVAAAELFLERGDFHRAARMLEAVPWAAASEVPRAELALRWILIASRSGDRALYRRWSERLADVAPSYPDESLPKPPATASPDRDLPELPFRRGARDWESQPYRGGYEEDGASYGPIPCIRDDWVAVVTPQTLQHPQALHRYALDGGSLVQTHALPRPKENRSYRDTAERARTHVVATSDLMVGGYVASANEDEAFFGYEIEIAVPRRCLRAVRVEDSLRNTTVWDTARSADSDLRTLSFNSRPVIVGKHLYALGWRWAGYIDCHLVCLEIETGRLVWRTILAGNQIELTMFGEISREPFLGELLVEGGVIYAGSNLGVLAAVNAWDGRIRWLTEYDALAVQYSAFRKAPKPDFKWERNPVVSTDARVIFTPLDSHKCLVVNKATGKVELTPEFRYSIFMLGVWDEHLVICGHDSVTLAPLADLTNVDRRVDYEIDHIDAAPALVTDGTQGGLVYSTSKGLHYRVFDEGTSIQLAKFEQPRGRRRRGSNWSGNSGFRTDGAVYVVEENILVVSSFRTACYKKKRETPKPFEERPR